MLENFTLLSLFDYSGVWSQPYIESNCNVIQLDIKHGFDIRNLNATWFYENVFDVVGTIDGVIAAPPCTHFSSSGAQYWKTKDADGRTKDHIDLIQQIFKCIDLIQPHFWVIENPVGRLNTLFPKLAKYGPRYFQPYEYGDSWSKKTGLWGEFNWPYPLFTGVCSTVPDSESWIMKLGGSSDRTKTLRSNTPPGFARAFFEANHWQDYDY